MNAAFEWAPFLPAAFAAALILGAAIVIALAKLRRAPDIKWRGPLLALLAILLLNPLLLHELRQGLPDKLVIVMDDSASQKIGKRDETAQQALDHITKTLAGTGIEPVVIRAAGASDPGKGESTNLFAALRGALPGIPLAQVAGTVLITDGQVHDVPDDLGALGRLGPFDAVLTGGKNEFDRKVTVVSAPKYGLLSKDVTIAVKVEEFGRGAGGPVPLSIAQDGKKVGETPVVPGETKEFTFRLDHPGQNVFEFTAPAEPDELTAVNNSAPVIVNGVRDRLRVLLVSGEPHMGERAWRNLLKSDPSIDLVHFTILRSVTSVDMASPNELSLIVFPVEELFQRKLKDFDLVIFDRYRQVGLLSQLYFFNIADYVKNGGAFLLAMGSDDEGSGIFNTALAKVLPISPDGADAFKGAYMPALTDLGKRHPVTAELQKIFDKKPWGKWFTQARVSLDKGQALMTGGDNLPLLALDRVGDGRVAVLTSDNVWLWSKGGETQGPYTRLLRNTAHWLMKEPELEDDYIRAAARGEAINVAQRDLVSGPRSVVMTRPTGVQETVALTQKTDDGWIGADVEAKDSGVYSFAAGEKKAFVVVGTAANEEFSDVHTTDEKLKPVVDKTGGATLWFREDPGFGLSALHLRRNAAYAVRSVESRPVVPDALALLLILGLTVFAWWRESGGRRS
jgi:hypothetical protein